jgi:hypothetical protein
MRGEVRFGIEAHGQRGAWPDWWSRIGFARLAGYGQRR